MHTHNFDPSILLHTKIKSSVCKGICQRTFTIVLYVLANNKKKNWKQLNYNLRGMAKQILIHLHPGKAATEIITEMDFYRVLVRGKNNDKKISNIFYVCVCVYLFYDHEGK